MGEIILSIVFGAVQGLTEFLPISSSGHLIIFHHLFKAPLLDSLAFDAFLHLGTLAALIFYFRKDLQKFILAFSKKSLDYKPERKNVFLILIAFLPAATVGFFLADKIEIFFRSIEFVSLAFIAGGLAIFIFDNYFKKNRKISSLSWADSLLIGLAQILAFIPGVSRSAITIIAGLGLNLKRDEAARFSFLLAIPITFFAGLKSFYDLIKLDSGFNAILLLGGFLSSAVFGYLCIKYFLKFLKNNSLKIFAFYRLAIGILLFLLLR